MTLPIINFLSKRIKELDPEFEHRPGTAFSELFLEPMSYIVQPLRDEANQIYINQSIKRILELDDPNLYPETSVDEIVGNLYVYRRTGSKASGIVRMYFNAPIDLNYLQAELFFYNTSQLEYYNSLPLSITAVEMANNTEKDFFYVDVNIEASSEGEDSQVIAGGIVTASHNSVVKVYNSYEISGGIDRETNIELIERTQKSIGVRDMNTGKGFNAIMFETFLNKLVELQPIGFGDPEMMRDIRYNYHIGGRIDGWVKTPVIKEATFDAAGLTIDYTRQLPTTRNVPLIETDWANLGVQNIDNSINEMEAYNTEHLESTASFIGGVNLDGGIDLNLNRFISLQIDDRDPQNIKISGAVPEDTRAGEIANRINIATDMAMAKVVVNPVVISRRRTGYVPTTSQVTLFDPTPAIFSNLFPGDMVQITLGPNRGSYLVDNVISDNELTIEAGNPFPSDELNTNYIVIRIGSYVKIESPTKGKDSRISLDIPTIGTSALLDAFGLGYSPSAYVYQGLGRYMYTESIHYESDLLMGKVKRVIGPTIVPDTSTGEVDESLFLEDSTTDVFLNVEVGDLVTFITANSPDHVKDFRVVKKLNNNVIQLDSFFNFNQSDIRYRVSRTGIKSGEYVMIKFDFNPLSIDVGDQIQLDQYGRELGIRDGREDRTITDLALLWITEIGIIDPISLEPTGSVLDGTGGYGQGGYGKGPYGIGSRAQYSLVVNKPELRFSALEDALISIDSAYLGQSFRVTYKHCPEIEEFHAFANSEDERVLDADVLMKHFIPAVVDIDLTYTVDPTNPLTATPEVITETLTRWIDEQQVGKDIDASDIVQVVTSLIDQTGSTKAKVHIPIDMRATVHNTDGTRLILKDVDTLEIPSDDIPSYTVSPLSKRTAHWVAGDIKLTTINPRIVGGF